MAADELITENFLLFLGFAKEKNRWKSDETVKVCWRSFSRFYCHPQFPRIYPRFSLLRAIRNNKKTKSFIEKNWWRRKRKCACEKLDLKVATDSESGRRLRNFLFDTNTNASGEKSFGKFRKHECCHGDGERIFSLFIRNFVSVVTLPNVDDAAGWNEREQLEPLIRVMEVIEWMHGQRRRLIGRQERNWTVESRWGRGEEIVESFEATSP
jgi:hypothetical protein